MIPVAREGPLAGRRIVVTRSREQASSLTAKLRALGATVIEIPTIAIVPPASYQPLDAALRELRSYQWLIVTSANTARVLGERIQALSLEPGFQPQTIAVGRSTASALERVGLRVDLVPEPAVAESIAAAMKDKVAGQRVLLVRAEVARDALPMALEEAGARLTIVDAYRTILAEASAGLVAATFDPMSRAAKAARREQAGGASRAEIEPLATDAQAAASRAEREAEHQAAGQVATQGEIDALTFTSSSTVENLLALLEKAGVKWPARARVFSIGPITSGTLRKHGLEPDYEAARHDIEGLVEVLLQGFATRADAE